MNYDLYCELFKALADENRICILKLLSEGEKCANEILEELNITQPTLSHHMKLLCSSGIVLSKKHGRQTFYITSSAAAAELAEFFASLSSQKQNFSEKEKTAPVKKSGKPKKSTEKKNSEKKKEVPKDKPRENQNDIWLF